MARFPARISSTALRALAQVCALFAVLLAIAAPALAGSLTLAWDPVTSPLLAGYVIHYGPGAGNYTASIDVGNVTTRTVSGLTEGATYHFAVAAYNGAHIEGALSNDVAGAVPYSVPVANFTASTVSGTAPLVLNFINASTGIITNYAWTFGDGTTSTVANPTKVYSTPGSYTVGLTVNGPGGSNVKTRPSYITVTAPTDTTPPSAPGTPTATASGSTSINLTWPAATDNIAVTGYKVERCLGASCTTFAQIGTSTGTSYSNSGLAAGTTYRYRVRANDAAGNLGPYSTFAAATTSTAPDTTPPSAPGTPTATASGSTSINLTWSAATDNIAVTGYKVERCLGASCTTFAQIGTSTGTSYSNSGLAAGTTYRYRVRANDAAGNLGPYSTFAAATTSTIAAAPTSPAGVWVEDAVPAGAAVGGDGEGWSWVSSNPAPFSGARAHQSALLSGMHQHYFYNATTTLSVAVGDTLFAYVYLDPANPPREVMLHWYDGSWEHRAYWGANLIGWGTDGTVSRRYMGPLPAAGQWVRLEVPASLVGLEGHTLNGMAYTLYDGRATWDYAGRISAHTVWVNDAVPAGAAVGGDGEGWSWVSSNPAPFSGALGHRSALLSGMHQHYFYNATTKLSVAVGDTLFAYVYLDPANPPREVMLHWYDGSWEHRAYWGANLIGWGTDGTVSRRYMGPLPAAGQWVRLEVPASLVGLEGHTLNGMAHTLYDGRATWDYAGKISAPTVWVEDAVPAGAAVGGDGEGWSWVSSNPAPFSGARAHQSALLSGMHQHYFYNATTTLSVAVGDTLFAYVYLDPANPPREVMLHWYDGSWEHRAYWGANLIGWGTDGTVSRRYMGPLPAAGQWVRLEVPASLVGLEGHTLNGMAYTLYDGRATWDYAGTN